MYQPTHLYTPGSPEAVALTDENSRRMIVLDDGSSKQNPAPIPISVWIIRYAQGIRLRT
jgi:predicted extracellular nuclease